MEDRSPKRFGLAAMALAVLAAPVVTTDAQAAQQNGSAAQNDTLPGKLGKQGTARSLDGKTGNKPHNNTVVTTKDPRQVPAGTSKSAK